MTRSFKLKPTTVHESFGEETVIVNLDSGSYYSALGLSNIIFNLVTDGVPEADILRRIKSGYSGDSEEISNAIESFLDQLVKESLVDAEGPGMHLRDGEQIEGETREPKKAFSTPLLEKYTDMEEMLVLDPIHEVDEHGWPSARRSPD